MEKTILFSTVSLVLFLFSTCNHPSSNESEKTSFFSFQIGDITQLINPSDSSTLLISIVGKEIRSDGQEGYLQISKTGTMTTDTALVFFKDGFLLYSQRDTFKDSSGKFNQLNPFFEQRTGLETPSNNQEWLLIPNDSNSVDLLKICYSIGDYLTLAGLFKNAFEYQLWDSDDSACIVKSIFCQSIGFIGAKSCDDSVVLTLSYAKIGSNIYGYLWPEKDPPINSLNKLALHKHAFFNYLGSINSFR